MHDVAHISYLLRHLMDHSTIAWAAITKDGLVVMVTRNGAEIRVPTNRFVAWATTAVPSQRSDKH